MTQTISAMYIFPHATMIFGRSGPRVRRVFPGFTLIELLVSMSVFLILLTLLLTVVSQTSSIWQNARNKIDSFRSARFAFDLINRRLSQATLNVYGDYDNPTSPTFYIRKSDLHFVIEPPPDNNFGQGNAIFFQARLGKSNQPGHEGMDSLLNATGYYVTYGMDANLPPFLAAMDRNRFRLMQYLEPSEDLAVYGTTDSEWFKRDLTANSTVIAENVIFVLFWPRLSMEEEAGGLSLTDDYTYDSRQDANSAAAPITAHQQPPLVAVTLVAIDKVSADRLPDAAAPPGIVTACFKQLFERAEPAAYAADLATLEERLNAARISYRIFTNTVPLRESKWTKQ
ncbi:MAG: Verru_Chthon cassette protein C [Verrucomicrobiales bacterium]|nr:Verru_Chthon cassette protein C [Verrucomicrobiales bacterium]